VTEETPDAVIMRPSIIFGPEDNFFNHFAAMARMAPALPLIGGGETRFQPVFVGNVAEAVATAIDGKAKAGTIYELGGPEVMTFREVLEFILKVTERERLLLPIPFGIARLMAGPMQLLPKPPLTIDQVRMLERDSIVSSEAVTEGRTLSGLGIEADTVQSIVPSYLERFRKTGEFRRPA